MYIFYSILSLLCIGFMIIVDHFVLSKCSLKFTLLIKSVIFVLFALIFLATKNSFDKLFSFIDWDYLLLPLITVLGALIFVLYNLSIKKEKPSNFAIFNVSSLLLFTNILFLIFSIETVAKNKNVLNIILVIIEMVFIVVNLASMVFLNKENNKKNMILMGIISLSLAGIVLLLNVKIKNKTLTFVPLEVFVFYIAMMCLILSILFFIFIKDKKVNEKKYKKEVTPWQNYLLAVIAGSISVLGFAIGYGAIHNYNDSNIMVVNMIIGLSFIVPVIFEISTNYQKGMRIIDLIKNNRVLLVNSLFLIISLVLFNLSSSI